MTAPARVHDTLYRGWVERLDRVKDEVVVMHHHRQIWKAIVEAIQERSYDTPATFRNHYSSLYVGGQAMTVRRLVKRGGNDKRSLARLIEDLGRNPGVMTRQRFLALHSPADHRSANELFDSEYGDGDVVDRKRIDSDIATLDAAGDRVVNWADEVVAHVGDASHRQSLAFTFGELDVAIDLIGDMFRRYALLLTSAMWLRVAPSIQNDWRATFRRPLFDPDVER